MVYTSFFIDSYFCGFLNKTIIPSIIRLKNLVFYYISNLFFFKQHTKYLHNIFSYTNVKHRTNITRLKIIK